MPGTWSVCACPPVSGVMVAVSGKTGAGVQDTGDDRQGLCQRAPPFSGVEQCFSYKVLIRIIMPIAE